MRPAIERATAVAIHVGAPLLVGGLLYLGWRTRGLLFWDWAAAVGVEGALGGLRGGLLAVLPAPPAWVRLSLPDALWVYGLSWGVARLQAESTFVVRALWLAVPALLGPGAELLQLVGLPGTFDAIDVGLCVGAFGLGAVVGARSGWGGPRLRGIGSVGRGLVVPCGFAGRGTGKGRGKGRSGRCVRVLEKSPISKA